MSICSYWSWTLFRRAMHIILDHWLGLSFRGHNDIRISAFIVWSYYLTWNCAWVLLFHISWHKFIDLCLTVNLLYSFLSIIFCLVNRSSWFLWTKFLIASISNHLVWIWILFDVDRCWIILKQVMSFVGCRLVIHILIKT